MNQPENCFDDGSIILITLQPNNLKTYNLSTCES